MQDGRTYTAKVLIGADGNLSQVRKQLLADGMPRFAGLAIWRAMRCASRTQQQREPKDIRIVRCLNRANTSEVPDMSLKRDRLPTRPYSLRWLPTGLCIVIIRTANCANTRAIVETLNLCETQSSVQLEHATAGACSNRQSAQLESQPGTSMHVCMKGEAG
jgi:2-polyprenyl-6-methoxyphenol hydroxylase-like FAD-dependent oxidoreductase